LRLKKGQPLSESEALYLVNGVKMRVTVIGCGNIGSALVRGLASGGHQLIACDANADCMVSVTNKIEPDIQKACASAEVVIVAVKPKDVAAVFAEVGASAGKPIVISVAAGVSTEEIKAYLGRDLNIVRVMPNLPLSVAAGVSAIYSADDNSAQLAEDLFSNVGVTIKLPSENLIAIATGLGGSGPAFVFSFCEAFEQAGMEAGLTASQAALMALETIHGATELLRASDKTAAELVSAVSTPGGTTMAGLEVLNEGKFQDTVKGAVLRAAARAGEKLSAEKLLTGK